MKNYFFTKVKIKLGKYLARTFPLNRVRCLGLRMCGFNVGKNVYIGPNLRVASLISKKGCKLKIEDRVAIGPNVTLVLSSDANNSKLMEKISPVIGEIILEKDSWIGACVVILPNVVIGEGAIVGASSMVNKSVPSNKIYAGNPAKFIKDIISN